MKVGQSIPEMIGGRAVPFERRERYSVESYRAQYVLTEDEAKDVRTRFATHGEIDLALSKRYITDDDYRRRVDAFSEDITSTPPTERVARRMLRLMSRNPPPNEVARAEMLSLIKSILGEDEIDGHTAQSA